MCLICSISYEKSSDSLMLVRTQCVFSLPTFFLLMVISNLIMMCLGVVSFICILLRVCWASWICRFVVFIKLEKLLPIILNLFHPPSPSFLGLQYMLACFCHWLVPVIITDDLLIFPTFASLTLDGFYCYIFKFTNLLLVPSVHFSFHFHLCKFYFFNFFPQC